MWWGQICPQMGQEVSNALGERVVCDVVRFFSATTWVLLIAPETWQNPKA